MEVLTTFASQGAFMRQIVTVSLLLALIGALSVRAQTPPVSPPKPGETPPAAEPLPSADQILTTYVQALGDKALMQKVTSRLAKGTFEIPAMGAAGEFENYAKAPNKSMVTFTLPGFGAFQQGFDGTVAWAQDPTSGLRELTGAELAAAKLDADFYREIRRKELYPTLKVTGKEKVGDRMVFVIHATPPEGPPEKWYFDTETGLLVRSDVERDTPQGKIPVETYYEDYKDVGGFKMPMTIRQSTPVFTLTLRITNVTLNIEIDDAKFKKPAAQ
jgi:hypothetical protein